MIASMAQGRRLKYQMAKFTDEQLKAVKNKRPALTDIVDELLKWPEHIRMEEGFDPDRCNCPDCRNERNKK
jgi:hypothetical protein